MISKTQLTYYIAQTQAIPNSNRYFNIGDNKTTSTISKIYKLGSKYHDALLLLENDNILSYIIHEYIFLDYDEENDKVEYLVNCNDIFAPASCFCEEFDPELDSDDFIKAMEDSPEYGHILWVARKLKMSPMESFYDNIECENTIKLFKEIK